MDYTEVGRTGEKHEDNAMPLALARAGSYYEH